MSRQIVYIPPRAIPWKVPMPFLRFQTRDVVFLALVSVGMLVASMVTVPFVVGLFATLPGTGAVVTAFFLGFFLALAHRRVGSAGVATFTSSLLGLVLAFVTPSMFFILAPLAAVLMATNLWLGTDWDRTLVAGMRMMTIAVSVAMFAFTTTPAQLVAGLESVRCPRSLTLAVMVMLRFLPVFMRDMERVRKSNGLRARPRRDRLRVRYRSFMMPVVSRVYTLSDTITLGLHTRGFRMHGQRTMVNTASFSYSDAFLLGLFLLLSAVVVMA